MAINIGEDQESSTQAGNILKIIFFILIMAITLLFGKISKKSTRFLGFFNSFSGGVFMGVGLFLLLPQSKVVFEEWSKANIEQENLQELPLCFFVSFGAYSFMLLVEKVFFSSPSLIPMIHGESGHNHGHSHEQEHDHVSHIGSVHEVKHGEEASDEDEDEEAFKNVVSAKGKFASFLGMRNMKMSRAENKPVQTMDRSLLRASQILTKTFSKPNEYNPDMDLLINPAKSDFNKVDLAASKIHSHDIEEEKPKQLSNVFPYLLLVALCIDGFFEGIALGVQTSWFNVLFVSFGIIIYKISIAFSLGISFKKSQTNIQTFIRFIILFSLFCPFGILVGYLSVNNNLLKAIFLSFASGTFIYVSTSVVIVEEFAITKHRFSKYFFYLIGGIATAAIALVGEL